jgi:hypothetical protein
MPYQVHDALLHAMSGTELSRVRTELRLLPREPINQVCQGVVKVEEAGLSSAGKGVGCR